MMTDYKFNLYILTSLAAHLICASFLLYFNGQLKKVDADIHEMVNIVLHQSAKPFTVSQVQIPQKIKVEPATSKDAQDALEKTQAQATTAKPFVSEGGQIGRLAKNTEELYIAELKHNLEKRKKYPVMAKKMGHTGRVTVRFEINRQGEIIHSEILEPSAHASLNDSVQKLLSETKAFKPLPEEIQRTTWKFILPVEFKL